MVSIEFRSSATSWIQSIVVLTLVKLMNVNEDYGELSSVASSVLCTDSSCSNTLFVAGVWKCMPQYIWWICEMVYGKNSKENPIIRVRGKSSAMMMMMMMLLSMMKMMMDAFNIS
ncbi:uncharacterized protein LOC119368491 [Triticum dicoccoides]|uniref:uncharacterized protein LOC119368491 n=1 Tax=Triticum dicoccoides TaxID=85692 RepID=UPI00188EF19B|nr:uncharacterized protein LOC119368491 [Triticum dicoccoides]